jgi:hypothetical protein
MCWTKHAPFPSHQEGVLQTTRTHLGYLGRALRHQSVGDFCQLGSLIRFGWPMWVRQTRPQDLVGMVMVMVMVMVMAKYKLVYTAGVPSGR